MAKFILEEYKLSPNDLDINRQTPLYYTARDGNISTSTILIQHGADVENIDAYGQTPIFYASRYQDFNVEKG
jgi:ankyrin repeat protein